MSEQRNKQTGLVSVCSPLVYIYKHPRLYSTRIIAVLDLCFLFGALSSQMLTLGMQGTEWLSSVKVRILTSHYSPQLRIVQ